MAHFARISDGIVIDRHVIANNEMLDADGVEQESIGQQYLANLWGGDPADYIQMSYNRPDFRGGYAGVGWAWDGTTFIPPVGPDLPPLTQNDL